MNRVALTGFFVLVLIGTASAQQLFQFSQYMQNPFILNPAAAGQQNAIDLNLSYRQQWTGFDDAPRTYYLSGSMPLNKVEPAIDYNSLPLRISDPRRFEQVKGEEAQLKHAAGGYVVVDEYGAFKRTLINASYAIHIPLDNQIYVSFGASTGLTNLNFNADLVSLIDEDDNTYMNFIGQGNRANLIDFNLGGMIYSDRFYFGYVPSQLLQNKFKLGGNTATDAKFNVHHYIMGGYRYDLNENISLLPNVLIKYVNPSPASVDINLQVEYQERIWGGISYRTGDAFVGMFGLRLNELFRLGYAYDYTTSNLGDFNNGSHEVLLGLTLDR